MTSNQLLAALAISLGLGACSSPAPDTGRDGQVRPPLPADTSLTTLRYTVEPAPAWSALFKRRSGWFGADGIFALPLSGRDTGAGAADTTLLVFSDTLIGQLQPDQPDSNYVMVHNSVAYLAGTAPDSQRLAFRWASGTGRAASQAASLFVPRTPATRPGDYYWLGDGFVDAEGARNTYVFGYRIRDVKGGAFGFQEMGGTLIVLPAGSHPPFAQQRQLDLPFFSAGPPPAPHVTFGAGVYVNTRPAGAPAPDGYVYVYGVRDPRKQVLVARVRPADFEHFEQWRFWDGHAWQPDMHRAAAVANRASNELSVSALPDGRYALVFQLDGVGRTVGLRLGRSPHGPFGPVISLWDCSADLVGSKNLFCYNAKAHPALAGPNELLISYNVNSFDFFHDIRRFPTLYRPRFIRVQLLPAAPH